MSNLVIVAIPDENDRVWKVSSEKIPHLTVLFLGDEANVANSETITQFVEHAVNTSLNRFYLPVDRRGELGEDKADVLFFKKGRYDYKAIRDFRASLLQENNIKTAYDSTEQFEGPWQPHLTLGYPATPAKPMEDEYPFYDVCFNKIAVWFGDYDGPEFLLKDYWDEYEALEYVPMDVAMSDIKHYGAKGMKWGVRKSQDGPVEGSAVRALAARSSVQVLPKVSKKTGVLALTVGPGVLLSSKARTELKEADRQIKLEKLDKKWKKQFEKNKKFVDVHNKAADEMDKFIVGHNEKYKDVDFTKSSNSSKHKAYEEEYLSELNKQYGLAVESVYGTSPSGNSKVTYDHDTGLIKVSNNHVQHAAEEDEGEILLFYAETDKNGHIVKTYPLIPAMGEDEEMAQTVELGAEFLAHYGVKGMRWGVRREGAVTTQTHIDSGIIRRRTKIQTKGGESQPAHTDAVKAAVQKQKIKKSGTDALSTQELRDLANRLQVENQVQVLMSSKGKRFAQQQLEQEGKNALKRGAVKAAPHVIKKAGKAAATGAVTVALI